MVQKLGRHADPGIPDPELVDSGVRSISGPLGRQNRDGPAGRREFQRVAQHIQQHLIQPQPVAHHIGMDQGAVIQPEVQPPGRQVRLDDGLKIPQDLGQTARGLLYTTFASRAFRRSWASRAVRASSRALRFFSVASSTKT